MSRFLVCVLLCLLSACASLTDAGEKVELTSDPARVKGCQPVGDVLATPPYGLPRDWKVKLRNAAAAQGANVVFAESPGLQTNVPGKAYRCAPTH